MEYLPPIYERAFQASGKNNFSTNKHIVASGRYEFFFLVGERSL